MPQGTVIPRRRGVLLGGFLLALFAPNALAQCPDGAPPPCRSATPEAHFRVASGFLDQRPLFAANAYLTLGDSSAALRMARLFVDSSMVFMGIVSPFIDGLVPATGAERRRACSWIS